MNPLMSMVMAIYDGDSESDGDEKHINSMKSMNSIWCEQRGRKAGPVIAGRPC